MSSPFQSINQRIIDDLRKSRGEVPTEYVPKPAPSKRDADDEAADEAYSSEGRPEDDVPFEAPEDDG
ncbi:MAG TPA: hypothetical protein VM621_00460 [Luteibacter sp.]|uniref:hypothetical protein n=1 Tax=Luteibacter sp. TaxID=1886636 RepID=UPI002C36265A|nr:hypothetical protein [Luteibacter sp.]HVI53506.1 hypothetical protein [Luteibacter sp.]